MMILVSESQLAWPDYIARGNPLPFPVFAILSGAKMPYFWIFDVDTSPYVFALSGSILLVLPDQRLTVSSHSISDTLGNYRLSVSIMFKTSRPVCTPCQ